jgi:hypothetical protein
MALPFCCGPPKPCKSPSRISGRRLERFDTGVSLDEVREIVGFAEWARIEETYRVERGP